MKRVFIKPFDVLMFRSSRPFNREGDRIAERGPITPLSFAGALKTEVLLNSYPSLPEDWYYQQQDKSFMETISKLVGFFGSNDDTKIKVYASFIVKDDEKKTELLPLPLDLVVDDKNKSIEALKPIRAEILSGDGNSLVGTDSFYMEPSTARLVNLESLVDYLLGSTPSYNSIVKETEVFEYERRFGIALDKKTKTTEEGMLYTAEFLRLREEYGFVVWMNTSEGLSDGYIKLGGEGKVAQYSVLSDPGLFPSEICKEIVNKINSKRKLKMYLATPAVFRNGKMNRWHPDQSRLEEKLAVKLSLVASSIDKPFYLGGWDMAKKQQKPLMRAVKEGAVYYYGIKEGKVPEDTPIHFSISDVEPYSGLGCAFLGVW